MEIQKLIKRIDSHALYIYQLGGKIILSILIIVLLAAMIWIVAKSIIILKDIFGGSIHDISKMVIVNVLMILALLEVSRTAFAYFSEGRVKVTYIIDTVLVVVLSEVMAFWFTDIGYQKFWMVIALVFTLIIARILAIRFSPDRIKDDV